MLLNQFHDILPGSSIHEVYQDARLQYEKIEEVMSRPSLMGVLQRLASEIDASGFDQPVVVFNPASTARGGLVDIDGELLLVDPVPACGIGIADAAHLKPAGGVEVDGLSLRNEHVFASFDEVGRVLDLRQVGDRLSVNAVNPDGTPRTLNQFVIYEDRPRRWEAWDIDRDYVEKFSLLDSPAERTATIEAGPLRGAIEFEHQLGTSSRLVVRYRLDVGSRRLDVDLLVDWREDQSLLRVEFPTGILAQHGRCGIQFGSIERPTHRNTSWEEARFEVPGHRWMDLSEPGRGLSVLDDGIVGRSFQGAQMGLSLLRATNFPDPGADRGEHRFRYSLLPHGGDWRDAEVDAEAEAFNSPLVVRSISGSSGSITAQHAPFSLECEGEARLEVAALKPAEDGIGVILRVVEKHGAHGVARVHVPAHAGAEVVDLREQPVELPGFNWDSDTSVVRFPVRPFGITTIRLHL